MTNTIVAGPQQTEKEILEWVRGLSSHSGIENGIRYAMVQQDLERGRVDSAIVLVDEFLYSHALSRSGFQLLDDGFVIKRPSLLPEEDQMALQWIEKFAAWSAALRLIRRSLR